MEDYSPKPMKFTDRKDKGKETAMTKCKYFTVTSAALILSGTLTALADARSSSVVGSPDDARITADVMEVIAEHRNLGAPNQIYVDTRDHVVYLSGEVTTSWMEYNAEDIARQVPGVTRVVSTIGVDE